MIVSFADAETAAVYDGDATPAARKRLPLPLWPVAQRKLDQLGRVGRLDQLAVPPGNGLEALRGDRKGQHSIRINGSIGSALSGRNTGRRKARSSITISPGKLNGGEADMSARQPPRKRAPTHPGEMLYEEFLKPLGVSQTEFADRIGVSYVRLNAIINRRRGVTPNTALRLEQATGMDADFWLGLQADWDLWHELRSPAAREIRRIERLPELAGSDH